MQFADRHPEILGPLGPSAYVLERHGQLVHDANVARHDIAKGPASSNTSSGV